MRINKLPFLTVVLLFAFFSISAQEKLDNEGKKDDPKKSEKIDLKKGLDKGEQVAEISILVYGNSGGRFALNQIRKTTVEVGKIKVTKPDGLIVNSEYQRRIMRGENLEKERVRLNQKFPDAEYSLIYDGKKIFGLYNNSVFTPREDAVKSFENQIWHGLEALLRYKENGSEIKLEKEEKIMGVDLYVVRVTDKQNRSTNFYVSRKTLRVMMLRYEEDGVKYQRKFYNHNYAQGTLVPYRTVLWADDKIIEEQEISTVTYGQTLDEALFQESVASTPF